jgi:hypothetical protein
MLTPTFLCRAALVQIIETAMNKEATQSNKPCNQQQPARRVRTGSEPGPVGGMDRCDRPKCLSSLVFGGKLIALTALSTIAFGSVAMVINLSNGMTAGTINFSLKLMQVIDVQLEIEKPASEELK